MAVNFEPANYVSDWKPAAHISANLNSFVYRLIDQNEELKTLEYEYFNGTEDVVAKLATIISCNDKPKDLGNTLKHHDRNVGNPIRTYEIIIPYKVDNNVLHYLWLIINAIAKEAPEDNIIPGYLQCLENAFGTKYDDYVKAMLSLEELNKEFKMMILSCVTGNCADFTEAQYILVKKLFCYTAIAIYHYVLGNPPVVVEKAASKTKADPSKPAPSTPVEKGSKTTTVAIDFELIHTMFMTLISINKPELLDNYTIIAELVTSANNRQEEHKKRNKPAPTPKKSSKSVNPAPSASADAIASATGN
jgi:hypothetical protein